MRSSLISFLCAFCFIFTLTPQEATARRPLVIIPGVLGSRLVNQDTRETIWPPLSVHRVYKDITRPAIRNFGGSVPLNVLAATCDQLRVHLPQLEFHPDTQKTIFPNGLLLELIEGMDWLSGFYAGLLTFLHSLDYVDQRDLFVFDYDWRQSNFDTARALQDFVDLHLRDKDFDILAHSMGGMAALIYVNRLDEKAQVRKVITIGSPYSGSLSAFRVALYGPLNLYYNLPEWAIRKCTSLRRVDFDRVVLSFISLYELLPTYGQCCYFEQPSGSVDVDVDLLATKGWLDFPGSMGRWMMSPLGDMFTEGFAARTS